MPARIAMPPLAALYPDTHARGYDRQAWNYVFNSAARVAEVEVDDGLKSVCWSAYEVRVDGKVMVVDISDYHTIDPALYRGWPAWLRFSYTPLLEPIPTVGSFPLASFLDWEAYDRMAATFRYTARSNSVSYGQPSRYAGEGEDGIRGKGARRRKVRAMLQEASGRHGWTLEDRLVELDVYLHRGVSSLVNVHIPGTNNHNLDRGQWQLMGLGACTLSPEIFTAPLGERPVAGTHYVRCRDDHADVVDLIAWCRGHRDECLAIGAAAKEFFATHGTPGAIWRYVDGRLGA